MNPPFAKVRAVFADVVMVPAAERSAALDATCGGDAALRAEVEKMLRADAESGLLDRGLATGLGATVARELMEVDVPPEQVGGFRLLRRLGAGGMGIVYEAEQDRPRRRVALKTLLPWLRRGAPLRWFEAEGQAMARLVHPGIPQVYAVFEAEGHPWIAMELVDGAPLDAWARGRSQRERVEILARVADTVSYAHLAGVVHGDLKPGNVLVTADARPKVLDFGLARLRGEAGGPTGAGTPGYAAPEQLGGGEATPAADVHALGAMLLELGGGAPARPGDEGLDRVLARALAPHPERRYPDAAALHADLRRWLADRPVQAAPIDLVYRARTALRRHRRAALLAVLAVGGLVAAVGAAGALEARDRGRRDADALARWAVARPVDLSDPAATPAVRAFTAAPENVGTAAVSEAWAELAAGLEANAWSAEATEAWALAYGLATDRVRADAARMPLARRLAEQWRWAAVDHLLLHATDPEAVALRASARVALRVDPLPDAIRPLGTGHPTQWPSRMTPLFTSAGAFLVDTERATASRVLADADLTEVETLDLPGFQGVFVAVFDLGGPVLFGAGVDGQLTAWRLGEGRAEVVRRWPITTVRAASPLTWPGEDRPRIVVGTGPYTRHLRVLSLDDDEVIEACPAFDRIWSDVNALRAMDLDHDGQDELVAAHGPWRGYELRVLRPLPGGHLALGGSLPLADPQSVAGTWVISNQTAGATDLFPHGVDRSGIVHFAGDGDGLRVVERIPFRFGRPWIQLVLADVDGDGLDEVLAGDDLVTAARAGAGGPLTPLLDVRVNAAAQLDDDAALEVVAALHGGDVLWVLGAGDTPLPKPPPGPEIDGATPRQALLREGWTRARQLTAFSLDDAARTAYDELARMAGDPTDRARLLREAAAIEDGRRRPFVAAELAAAASAAAPPSHEERRVDGARLRRLFDPVGAAAVDGGEGGEPLPPVVAVPLDDGLAGWTVTAPELLRSGPDGLDVDLFSDQDEYARVDLDAGPVVVLTGSFRRFEQEPPARLEIGLRSGKTLVGATAYSTGGGGVVSLSGGLHVSGIYPELDPVEAGEDYHFEVRVDRAARRFVSRAWVGERPVKEHAGVLPAGWGDDGVALVLQGMPDRDFRFVTHGRVQILGVALGGAALHKVGGPHALVLGDFAAAEVDDPALAAWVAWERGERDHAVTALAAALTDPRTRRTVVHLLRADPDRATPLVRAAAPSAWMDLMATAWTTNPPAQGWLYAPELDDLPLHTVENQHAALARAQGFLAQHEVPRALGLMKRLLADPDLDPVIGTTAALALVHHARTPEEQADAVDALRQIAVSESFAQRLLEANGLTP